jgi:glycosyltransferase involved in cell wall biosynthesis
MPRESYGLSGKDIVIVYSGRLTKEKGILQLIQAMKQLHAIPNLKLLVIGASSYGKDKHPTPFIEQLNKESESIKDRVIYTGFIDYQQVPSILKMSDIAVVPSMWEEPFGLTVIEAMAAGLPLITTRSGGIPEICEGVATIVNRDNIVENLANAILDLYHNPEKRVAMSKASLERSKMFDKETYARNFFEAIKDIHP